MQGLTVCVGVLLQHGVLRLNMVRIAAQQNLYLVQVARLVVAQLPLHAVLDMRALRMQVVRRKLVVRLADAYLRGRGYLLLTAATSLQTHLGVVCVYVPCLLHGGDRALGLRLQAIGVALTYQELLVFVVEVLTFEVFVDLQLQLVNAVSRVLVLSGILICCHPTVVVEVAFAAEDLVVLETVAELTLVKIRINLIVVDDVDLVPNHQSSMLLVVLR